MKVINIHIYKTILTGGNIVFEVRAKEHDWSPGFKNIESCVKTIKDWINEDLFIKENFKKITIDLTPYHDFEIAKGLAIRKCVPLSHKESEELWKEFKK